MRRSSVLLLAAALLAVAPAASAADDARVAEARALFGEGVRLFKAGSFEQARVKFAAAYALVDSDDILWNLAVAEASSDHAPEALNHYRKYARSPKARPADVATFESKWLPRLEPSAGDLRFEGPAGTRVEIDDAAAGVLPLGDAVAAKPGHHVITAYVEGTKDRREVDVVGRQTVTLRFGAAAPAPAVAAAPVTSSATTTSAETSAAPPADTVTPSPAEQPNPLHTWVPVGLGAGAVALVVTAGVFSSLSSSAADDQKRLSAQVGTGGCASPSAPGCADLADAVHRANTDHDVATGMFVGAGVLAAGAVVTWVLIPRTKAPARAAFVPMVGPSGAGGVWRVAF